MSGFDGDWLRLRAPFDGRARSRRLEALFAETLPSAPHILDLAAGTGANFRHLATRLRRGPQRWTLVDHDPALLGAVAGETTAWAAARGWEVADAGPSGGISVSTDVGRAVAETRRLDLWRDLERLDLDRVDAVVSTAFLDLVSEAWLDRLVFGLAARRIPVLFTLSVDGVLDWYPADPADDAVRAAFEADQARDKGLGPALGARAVPVLADRLAAAGYHVETARSDWAIGSADRAMHAALIGFHVASAPDGPEARTVRDWADRRLHQANEGHLTCTVGHLDLAAWF